MFGMYLQPSHRNTGRKQSRFTYGGFEMGRGGSLGFECAFSSVNRSVSGNSKEYAKARISYGSQPVGVRWIHPLRPLSIAM